MSRRPALSILAVLAVAFLAAACCGSKCIKDPPCKPDCGCAAPTSK